MRAGTLYDGYRAHYVDLAVMNAISAWAGTDPTDRSSITRVLSRWIRPGNTVLLKPNWVKAEHPRDPDGWQYLITHGAVIRAVAEQVALALNGTGRIIVADGPQTDSAFAPILHVTGANDIAESFRERGIDFEFLDFRQEFWTVVNGVVVGHDPLPGDPEGYVEFNLCGESRFAEHAGAGRYYGAFYDTKHVNAHHSGGRHEYLIAGTALKADVFINLPKLKTHKKTGVTLNLKNLVGINGDKNYLPHHTEGDPTTGGDQFPSPSLRRSIERHVARALRTFALRAPGVGPWVLGKARNFGRDVFGDTEKVVRSGNWHGNDTAWRMALDLNTILLYGRPDGTLGDERKPYLSFVDGIVGGDGSGPLNPDPVQSGFIAFGADPADVDAVCAWLMGFDPDRLPLIREAYAPAPHPIATGSWRDIRVVSNDASWNKAITDIKAEDCVRFRPHFGWVGAIERTS